MTPEDPSLHGKHGEYGPGAPRPGGPGPGNPAPGPVSGFGPPAGVPPGSAGPPGNSAPANSSRPSPPPDDLVDHPDLDTLADLDAGLLEPADAARAGRHASSCAHCRTTLAAFVAVRRDLRGLTPPKLPEAVATRLDATVAQLRASGRPMAPPGSPQHGPPGHGPAPPQVPIGSAVPPRPPAPPPADLAAARETREQRRIRGRRLTGRVAASVIVAAALVGVGTAILQHTDDNGSVATSAAIPGQQSSNNGHGGSKDSAGGSEVGPTTVGPQSVPTVLPSFDDEGSLLAAIPEITTKSAVQIITQAGRDGPAGAMADGGRRSRCTSGITGTFGSPVAVQRIIFENQTAYVFVYANPVTGGHSVVVVTSDCGDVPVPRVLYRHTD